MKNPLLGCFLALVLASSASAVSAQSCPSGTAPTNTNWIVINRAGDSSNAEQETYCPQSVTFGANGLTITAQARETNGLPYDSGAVTSNFTFSSGTLEYKAQMMGGAGAWPAIWILGSQCQPTTPSAEPPCNWPNPGADELDITEILNSDETQINQQIHSSSGCGSGTDCGCKPNTANVTTAPHVYDLVWGNTIGWYVDGVLTCSQPRSALSATPHYIIINAAIGGTGTTTPNPASYPQTMTVTSMAHYASTTYPPTGTPDWTDGFGGAVASKPSPESSLKASVVQSGSGSTATYSVALSWTQPTMPAGETVASVNVYRGGTLLVTLPATAVAYSDTNVAPGQTYSYYLTNVDTSGNASVPTATVTASIPAAPGPISISTKTLPAGTVGTPYNASIAAAGGSGALSYSATLATGLIINSGTGVITGTPTTAGTFPETVTVSDAAGDTPANASYSVVISAAAPPPPPTKSFHIRAGELSAYTDSTGVAWSADADYTETFTASGCCTDATSHAITSALPSTKDGALYSAERWGVFSYTFSGLPAGSYKVTLKFREASFSATKKRLFNVAINGKAALTSFDIYATAKAEYKAVDETFTATVTSAGTVTIAFTQGSGKVDYPTVSAIAVAPN